MSHSSVTAGFRERAACVEEHEPGSTTIVSVTMRLCGFVSGSALMPFGGTLGGPASLSSNTLGSDNTPPLPTAYAKRCVALALPPTEVGSIRNSTALDWGPACGCTSASAARPPSATSSGRICPSGPRRPQCRRYASTWASSSARSTSTVPATKRERGSSSWKRRPRAGGAFTLSCTCAASTSERPTSPTANTRRQHAPGGGSVPFGSSTCSSSSA
mmetsp:Transcript_42341/g.113602  ORF Transcript_42341/g.113602 Transcript_42341/m.113602 type:complete len:216 (+) Transcript_42341:304-951(+)